MWGFLDLHVLYVKEEEIYIKLIEYVPIRRYPVKKKKELEMSLNTVSDKIKFQIPVLFCLFLYTKPKT